MWGAFMAALDDGPQPGCQKPCLSVAGPAIKVYLLSQRTRKISFLVDINIYLICSLSRGKARLQF
jgi:hypothetical protein